METLEELSEEIQANPLSVIDQISDGVYSNVIINVLVQISAELKDKNRDYRLVISLLKEIRTLIR